MGDVRRLVEALRAAGVTVHEWAGWDGRGNEGVPQIQIKGGIIHHTGTAFGHAFPGLVSSTRPDLKGGLLANFAGNVDGSLTVLGSGLAWHAGGGFGPNQGVLAPYANRRNYWTVGLEIVYPGNVPMKLEQYRTALIFAKIVAELFAGGNLEYVRGHSEVNGRGWLGKWDPGFAPGQAIDMNAFRRDARAAVTNPPQEEEKDVMFQVIKFDPTPEIKEEVVGLPDVGGGSGISNRWVHIHAPNADVTVAVAHFRLNDGSLVHMLPDNTVIPAFGRTAGVDVPLNAHELVVDYKGILGASVVVEAK
jgi:hypothetical protein